MLSAVALYHYVLMVHIKEFTTEKLHISPFKKVETN